MRLSRLAEWQHAIDNRTNLTLLDKLHRLEQFRFRTHKRAEYVQVTVEDLSEIGVRVQTTRRAARHEPPVRFETRD